MHRIDAWSPLLPPTTATVPATRAHNASSAYAFPDSLQRVNDLETGNREIVGSTGPPPTGPTTGHTTGMAGHPGDGATPAAIAALMADTDAEVLVLVEGIDPSTSYTLQARHSYKREDIVFGGGFFAPCVSRDPADGACVIDFGAFHSISGPDETGGTGSSGPGQTRSAIYEGGVGAETAPLHHQSHA